MDVILKKTKITKSIIDQSLRGSYGLHYNWEGYDILGWVGIKKAKEYYRWTLLYKRNTHQIIKIPYIDKVSSVEYYNQNVQRPGKDGGYDYPLLRHIKVKYPDKFSQWTNIQDYLEETNEEMDSKFEAIKKHILEVNQKGQIYI